MWTNTLTYSLKPKLMSEGITMNSVNSLIIPLTKEDYPEFEKKVILFTDKGTIMGYLMSIGKYGFKFKLETDNDIYWNSAIPHAYMEIPIYNK